MKMSANLEIDKANKISFVSLNNEGLDFLYFKKVDSNSPDLYNWIKDNRQEFEDKLRTYGAILFRGYKVNTISKFEELSKLYDSDSLEYAFRSSPRFSVGKNVYTSTSYPKDFCINMHSEASYMPEGHPHNIVFCCINPPLKRGETPIADNHMVLKYLSEETRTKFMSKGVKYVRNLNKNLGLSWEEVFQTNNREEIEAECLRTGVDFQWNDNGDTLKLAWNKKAVWEHPQSQKQVWFNHTSFFNKVTLEKDYGPVENEDHLPNNTFYGDGTEITKEEIEEILEAYKKATIEFPWKRGDVLFLDNMLVSHGRNPYEGKRNIITSLF